MITYGYDPLRIEQLHRRAAHCVASLRAIRHDDPAARDALHLVARLRRHLEDDWLSLLTAIRANTAMTVWRTTVTIEPVPAWLGPAIARFGSTWVVATGLEDVATGDLLRGLSEALAAFELAAERGEGDASAAWRRLDAHLAEVAARLDRDPQTVALVWRSLGGDGLTQLLGAQATAIELARLGLLGTGAAADVTRRTTASLAVVLGAVTRHDVDAAALVVRAASWSVVVADALAADPARFDPDLLVAIAADLLATLSAVHALTPLRADDIVHATGASLRAVTTNRAAALRLLLDDAALRTLSTSRWLDDDDVERVVTSALVAGYADDDRLAGGLEVLGALTEVTADDSLNDGTRRGVAMGIGPYLETISTQLAAKEAPTLIVTAGDDLVRVADRPAFRRFVGQVADDERAQLVLGVSISAFRADRLAAALTAIAACQPGKSCERLLVDAMSDVHRIPELVRTGIADRDGYHALQHALRVGAATRVADAMTTALALFGPVGAVVRAGSRVGSAAVVAAAGWGGPSRVPRTNLFVEQERDAYRTILAVPLEHPELRAHLDLDDVKESSWGELAGALADLEHGQGETERANATTRLLEALRNDAVVDAYVTEVRNGSGMGT